ncbi:MAG TPA: substrate-binding domain-containing protein, partial [Propionibacteriaceae bacterium]
RTSDAVEADSAEVDAGSGISELASRMLELGHRRIGAIFGPRNASTAEHREQALRDALATAEVTVPSAMSYRGPFDFETGLAGAHHLLNRDEPPTVIVCGNDVVAFGALNAAVERGLDVPDDVSIVGFDDLPAARWPLLQLTTVAFDLDAMARRSASLLVARIEDDVDAAYRHESFPSRLVERATLARPRG